MHRFLGIALASAAAAGGGAAGFTLTSSDIREGGTIAAIHVFNGMGCTGGNQSPALEWHGAPSGTKSFAITAYDPDAPTGSGWWHWLVYNLPVSTTHLARGAGDPDKPALPPGASQGRTDFGIAGYGGPCPPPGKPHHYIFTVYALDVAHLDIPANVTAANVGFNIHAHVIAKATITALYGK